MDKSMIYHQIKDFFIRNLDLHQEKEDELDTIESKDYQANGSFTYYRLVRF